MDIHIFPPDAEDGGNALRMMLPDLKVVGSAFVKAKRMAVRVLDLKADIFHKADGTLRLEVSGKEDAEARLLLGVDGLDLRTPRFKTAEAGMKGIKMITNAVEKAEDKIRAARKITLPQHREVGSGYIDVYVKMAGDLSVGADGYLALVPSTATENIRFQCDVKGFAGLKKVLNTAIYSYGKAALFKDQIWPLIEEMLPRGLATQRVKNNEILVQGQGLENEQLDLTVKLTSLAHGILEHALDLAGDRAKHALAELWTTQQGFANVKTSVNGTLSAQQNMELNFTSMGDISSHVLTALTALTGQNSLQYSPDAGMAAMRSGVALKDGIVRVPDMTLDRLRLPCEVLMLPCTGALELSAKLRNVSCELLESSSGGSFLLPLFKRGLDLQISLPDLLLELDRMNGLWFSLGSGAAGTATASLPLEFVLSPVSQLPPSERRGPQEAADGAVPGNWKQPPARRPGVLDLHRLLGTADFSLGAGAKLAPSGVRDLHRVEVNLNLDASMRLSLDASTWQGLLDSADFDYGLFYALMPGRYVRKGQTADKLKETIAVLSCGFLDLYTEDVGRKPPFSSAPAVSIDLAATEVLVLSEVPVFETRSSWCFTIDVDGGHFCSPNSRQMEWFWQGVTLQKRRFRDSADASERAGRRPGDFVMGTTWFTEARKHQPHTGYPLVPFDPRFDFSRSPKDLWRDALTQRTWQ